VVSANRDMRPAHPLASPPRPPRSGELPRGTHEEPELNLTRLTRPIISFVFSLLLPISTLRPSFQLSLPPLLLSLLSLFQQVTSRAGNHIISELRFYREAHGCLQPNDSQICLTVHTEFSTSCPTLYTAPPFLCFRESSHDNRQDLDNAMITYAWLQKPPPATKLRGQCLLCLGFFLLSYF